MSQQSPPKMPPEPPKVGYAFFASIPPRGRILLGVMGMIFSGLGLYMTEARMTAYKNREEFERHRRAAGA